MVIKFAIVKSNTRPVLINCPESGRPIVFFLCKIGSS